MRRYSTLFILLALLMSSSSYCQEAWPDKTRVLPELLRQVPEVMYIRHDPNPNYPQESTPEDRTESAYIWKHSTSVTSPDMELTVVAAGSFIWYSEAGWMKNVELDRKGFAKKFDCPRGILEQGITYTFERNYRYGDRLYGGDALWYVIAVDEEGNRYKGMSILETESELR